MPQVLRANGPRPGLSAALVPACFVLLAALAPASSSAALGPTLTFKPSADAYVTRAEPRRNFGRSELLEVAQPSTRSYMRFRVRGLSGPVSRDESLRAMQSASALLLLQPGTTVSVPGKLFEYLATGRPILALTEESETAELVRASGVGVAVLPDDEAAIAGGLLAMLAFGRRPLPSVPRTLWDGRVRARETAEILERVVANRQAVPDATTATA